jgi:ethanolamine utilization microcompartment shell protein EutL
MSEAKKDPTLAELDAAVEAARVQVMAWGPEPDISTRYWVMADDVNALIAAAEARGAARERVRVEGS